MAQPTATCRSRTRCRRAPGRSPQGCGRRRRPRRSRCPAPAPSRARAQSDAVLANSLHSAALIGASSSSSWNFSAVSDGLADGHQAGVGLPSLDQRDDRVVDLVDERLGGVLPGRRGLGGLLLEPGAPSQASAAEYSASVTLYSWKPFSTSTPARRTAASAPGSMACTTACFRFVAPRMNGWSRSSPLLSRRFAASASVRATRIPGTPMMSSWNRAAFRRLICSSTAPEPCRPDGRTSWCPDAGPRCGSR